MIMAYPFNKLFPRIPHLPPKTQFIKIKFINQGLDLLNINKRRAIGRGSPTMLFSECTEKENGEIAQ